MPKAIDKWNKSKAARRRPRRRTAAPSVRIERSDAFNFLENLSPGSVDLFLSSPPYYVGKEYDRSNSVEDFVSDHERLAPLLVNALKKGGSICWQVGTHVKDGVATPLDAIVYQIFSKYQTLRLRNRIVWTFGHGMHSTQRFSGRHETILWFTNGDDYFFDLDSVRVPQKYPGKRHYKGPNKGEWSGNPSGKNPSDVWEIPNVKAQHVEKTLHPCQFPVALAQRCIRALTKSGGLVVDPFLGSGTSAVAAAIEHRQFAGCDISSAYLRIAKKRIKEASAGRSKFRPLGKPVHTPTGTDAVSKAPAHFAFGRDFHL